MRDLLFSGARLMDPATGLDQVGSLLVRDGTITDLGPALGRPDGVDLIECDGAILCPGLVDMRAALGEPGYEYRETVASAARAAASSGITTLAALPDSLPAIDDPALVRLLRSRGEETGSLTILPYAAVTRGCRGEEMAEIGLLREAGAVAFTDGRRAVGDARMMRLALSYARGFGALIVQHPEDYALSHGGAATEGALATRMGLPGIPAAAEAILRLYCGEAPEDREAHDLLGYVCYRRGKFTDSFGHYESARRLDPFNSKMERNARLLYMKSARS